MFTKRPLKSTIDGLSCQQHALVQNRFLLVACFDLRIASSADLSRSDSPKAPDQYSRLTFCHFSLTNLILL